LLKFKLFLVILIFAIFVLLLISCVPISEGILQLLASGTPTKTSTPILTATASATPTPPLSLSPCVFIEFCPDALDIIEYSPDDEIRVYNKSVMVPYNKPVLFKINWIAQDEVELNENLMHVKWIFSVDGQDLFNEEWMEIGKYTFYAFPGGEVFSSKWLGVVVQDWKIGEQHTVNIGYLVEEDIFNGWKWYYAGTTYQAEYQIIPIEAPTATITPTVTITPTATIKPTITRTNMPKPTAIPLTKTPKATPLPTEPPCSANKSFLVENNTGGYITIDLIGPMKYHADLPAGNTTIMLCQGTYSAKAWGCGGATRMDTFDTNSNSGTTYTCE
jgi:hypothetical protein